MKGNYGKAPVTAPVTLYVEKLLHFLASNGEAGNEVIRNAFGLKDRRRFRETYLQPALKAGLIEMTIPDKPQSRLQRYRLTKEGRKVVND